MHARVKVKVWFYCRSRTDIQRARDRYECILDNYPPSDDPIAMAQTVVRYMEGQVVPLTAFNISGIIIPRIVGKELCEKL